MFKKKQKFEENFLTAYEVEREEEQQDNCFFVIRENEHLKQFTFSLTGLKLEEAKFFPEGPLFFSISEGREKGYFGSQTCYYLKTEPENWVVKRHLRDFQELGVVLSHLYPFEFIEKFDDEDFKEYQDLFGGKTFFLENFLQSLTQNKLVQRSECFRNFLAMDSHSLQNFFKELKKEISYPQLESFKQGKKADPESHFFEGLIKEQPFTEENTQITNSHLKNELFNFLKKNLPQYQTNMNLFLNSLTEVK